MPRSRIGDSILMMAEESPDWGSRSPQALGGSPVSMMFYVADATPPYFPEGLLGHTFLGRGFQAGYVDMGENNLQVPAREPLLFLAVFKSPKAAKDALTTYKSYVVNKGTVFASTPKVFGPDAWKGEDPYHGQLIVVQRGHHLLGAAGFTENRGELYLDTFIKKIR